MGGRKRSGRSGSHLAEKMDDLERLRQPVSPKLGIVLLRAASKIRITLQRRNIPEIAMYPLAQRTNRGQSQTIHALRTSRDWRKSARVVAAVSGGHERRWIVDGEGAGDELKGRRRREEAGGYRSVTGVSETVMGDNSHACNGSRPSRMRRNQQREASGGPGEQNTLDEGTGGGYQGGD